MMVGLFFLNLLEKKGMFTCTFGQWTSN